MSTWAPPRRAVVITVLRVLMTTTVLFVLYAAWPLQDRSDASAGAYLAVGIVGIGITFGLQIRSILHSSRPALRAVEALATSIPLLLISFAAGYLVLSESDPASFSEPLSKVTSLYFTVTTFATVGFGDITPASDPARIVVTVQMLLNLLVLGLGIRIVAGAVRVGRQRQGARSSTQEH